MANTYTQIHLQFVFAVKHRTSLISPVWKKELYLYISGIVENNGHKLLAINGMPDHIHKQEEHHKKQSFKEEYLEFLKKFDVDYDEKYIFREPA
ncbi:transposase [Flavobacterium sp. ST-75]|uniref:Transposase n=1 Tax=Flavobacterium rhizophilum TaxID=3163296 RepID=A0ABW8YE20_9FLAO